MSIQSDVVSELAGICGDRIYPHSAPQDSVFPFVIFRRVSYEQLSTLMGSEGTIKSTFLFECYAKTYIEAIDISEQILSAINAATGLNKFIEPFSSEEYIPDVDVFMEPVQISFWHA